jgi:hypothetical protein
MANTINWGQAAVENTIDYGQGATDNTISWGKSQTLSPGGETNITGSGGTPAFSNVNSFTFNGVDEYFVGVGTYSELNGQNKATFSAWIKPTATNLLGVILHTPRNTSASDSQFQILIDNANRLRFQIQNTGTYVYSNTGVFTANTWSHILVCYDGTLIGSTNRGKIFIDGVDQTSAVNLNVTSFQTATGGLMIAEHSQSFWNPFSGKIDEVAIWSGSDQQANVSEIWNGGLPNDLNNLPTVPQPTTWQRFGDNGATWNGFTWTMTDVNGSYVNRGVNMVEANRTTDVPT